MFGLSRKRGAAILAAALSGLMVLSACGGGAATPTAAPTATKAAVATTAPTAAASATKAVGSPVASTTAGTATPSASTASVPGCTGPCKPVEGGTFTEYNASDPISWNTFTTSLSVAQHQIHLTHSDLIRHCSLQRPDDPAIQ